MPPRQRLILLILIPLTAITLALLSGLSAQPSALAEDDLRLAPSFYLSAASTQWLALVALAPLLVALLFAWRHEQPVPAYLQPEMMGTYGWWIALANGYAAIYLVALTNLLPRFEPPLSSIDDPRLGQAPLGPVPAVIVVAVVAYFIWFAFGRQNGFGRMADRISLPHRRTALLILLSAACAAIWVFGGLTFSVLIIPAAWLWIFIEPRTDRPGQAANVALALGGIAPFVLAYFLFPHGLNVWQWILAAGYTVLFPFDALAFLLIVALFIRFVRLGLSAPYIQPRPSAPPGAE